MKILISEQQLKRIIKEFQDIYDDGIDRLTKEIEQEIMAGGFEMGSRINGEYKFYDDWPDRREKESFRLLKILKEKVVKFLMDYFKLGENLIEKTNQLVDELFHLTIHDEIQYSKRDLADWHMYFISHPNTGKYDFNKDKFKKSMNHIMKLVKELLSPEEKKELDTTIDLSKTKYSPKYSGEEIEDEDTKVIYNWEHTKNLLENLIKEYIHNEKYVSTELFNKITELGVIETVIDIMDEDMKNNEYKIFHPILQNNWSKDFLQFVKSYITYYGKKYNGEEQFRQNLKVDENPIIFFGRMLWDMTYWINR